MSGEERVDQLLADRGGVPWALPSAALRQRTLTAIEGVEMASGAARGEWMKLVPLAAAACLAMGMVVLVLRSPPTPTSPPPVATVRLDPAPMFGSALRGITDSAEQSLHAEAREFLDDADRLTRRVVAQLPFTRGGS